MTKNNNKSTAIILAAVLIAAVAGIFAFTHKAESPAQDAKDSWAIYWYMCGSNLESFYGCGSADLEEAMAANLSPNVSLVIETGGTYAWNTDKVSAGQIQRHVLNKDGFNTVDTLPDANMGEGETLRSFLEFCEENYPADKKMLLLWNHGGGSVGGVAFDETNSFDSLDLLELRSALEDIYPGEEVPFELVGFDACLMATIDVANIFADKAKYMVASEDLEPANGWGSTD
ncbi:MAG: clostripain-related cysteine peptidase, partial [Clostridia bacterium]|nr:clostripain-related cysteine peptidase [Clostridia bacterium]